MNRSMATLIQRANQFSERIAVVSDNNIFTYGILFAYARQVATTLLGNSKDLEEARIAFLVTPGFGYVAVQWGIWLAGGVAVPLCNLHPLNAIQYVIEDTGAKVLITSPEYEKFLAPLVAEKGIRFFKTSALKTEKQGTLPSVTSDRRAMILYTSGTTSKPKGVVTTHFNIESQITTLVNFWEWEQDDYILNILPLHHVHGIINVMSCALWSGACVEFLPKFDAAKVWDIFKRERLTLFMAVPTIYFKLINYWEHSSLEKQKKMSDSLQRMRLMVSGSAALPVSFLEKWKLISGHTLLERYGMTEIGMGLSNAYRGERRPGHVGLPLPGVEMRLVDSNNNLVYEGQPGEIQVKGNSVFLEYWQKPQATKEAFIDGWFKTGDIARFNNGMYKILGRDSVDIIKSGGYKISALEIEEILRTHPDIKECAVVGIPDEEWGQIIGAALITQNHTLNREKLKSWLSDNLPSYKLPRKYLTLDNLPSNTLGKVTKKAIVDLFQKNEENT